MATTEQNNATTQQRLFDILIERIRGDSYPSHQLMDRIEANLYTPEQIVEYAEVLNDKIDEHWYPSHQMISRAERLIHLVDAADRALAQRRRIEAQEDSGES